MYLLDSLLSATSLSMDAFAVALCAGAGIAGERKAARSAALRMGAACGASQFLMPLGGWILGAYAIGLIASFDHWVAFGLLAFVGGNMIRGAFEPGACTPVDTTRLATLLYLALATSIDALAVGASFAIAKRPVMPLAISSGLVTAALCYAGVSFGRYAGDKMGKRVEFAGGLVLILIGLNILREHLL